MFLQNVHSNASCFSLLWLYLANSQVSVYRTIGPMVLVIVDIIDEAIRQINRFAQQLKTLTYEPCM